MPARPESNGSLIPNIPLAVNGHAIITLYGH